MQVGATKSRHEARERALQVLYAVEVAEHVPEKACDELLNEGEDRYLDFARTLVLLAVEHCETMDELIRDKAQRWDFNRIAILDRLILRLALCEFFYLPDVPPKVTINEAIEVAKEFSTEQSGRFINGILDAVFGEKEADIRKLKKSSVMGDSDKALEKTTKKKKSTSKAKAKTTKAKAKTTKKTTSENKIEPKES
ncbi:MAG: transcription antitermination factor NusB [Candidatus Electryonea clarkiae]|nr:transcription antitermination factor NusB [Candidatus Electryonea clarkiae]MDP8286830.1 transcription antitermination factor NusB [Candidatus Electryonea clarkiae]